MIDAPAPQTPEPALDPIPEPDREPGPLHPVLLNATASFDPRPYLKPYKRKNRDGAVSETQYLDVKWRVLWLRTIHPDARIETECVSQDDQFALFKARVVIHGQGDATGWGSETRGDFTDYIEKAETKALGRALAHLGFGTQFATELDGGGLADSPVDRPTKPKRPPTAAEVRGSREATHIRDAAQAVMHDLQAKRTADPGRAEAEAATAADRLLTSAELTAFWKALRDLGQSVREILPVARLHYPAVLEKNGGGINPSALTVEAGRALIGHFVALKRLIAAATEAGWTVDEASQAAADAWPEAASLPAVQRLRLLAPSQMNDLRALIRDQKQLRMVDGKPTLVDIVPDEPPAPEVAGEPTDPADQPLASEGVALAAGVSAP